MWHLEEEVLPSPSHLEVKHCYSTRRCLYLAETPCRQSSSSETYGGTDICTIVANFAQLLFPFYMTPFFTTVTGATQLLRSCIMNQTKTVT